MNIVESNRMIAVFDGWKLHGADDYYFASKDGINLLSISELDYHSNWHLLIPVVEKIESMGYTFKICRRRVEINIDGQNPPHPLIFSKCDTKMLSVYSAVVSFIEWYNKQKQ